MNAEEQILFSIWSVVACARERKDPEMLKSALRALRIADSELGQRAPIAKSVVYGQSQSSAH